MEGSAYLPVGLFISLMVLVGLQVSNSTFDKGLPHYLSRKIAHGVGGLAYLICYLVNSEDPGGWLAFGLSGGFAVALGSANLYSPSTFRGVGGSGRPTKGFSEVYFPLSALPVIGIGWILLDDPKVALACLLFMAWGDMITGIVRNRIYHKAVKGTWGSAAMLVVCVTIGAILVTPLWIGLTGALMATTVEKECGDVGRIHFLDDNLAIPVFSALLMLPLVEVFS